MKSVETQFAEACDKLRTEKKFRLFNEKRQGLKTTAIEPQLNLALAVLAGEVKESTPIRKFNGEADNGTLLTESAPGDVAAANKSAIAGYTILGFSEAEARKVLGLAPAEVEAMGHAAETEYRLALAVGISESDAVRLCKK
jgi:hypothetical protein